MRNPFLSSIRRGLVPYRKGLTSRLATSLSDNEAYPQVCLDASRDYALFRRFRRDPVYNQILEHLTEDQGRRYLQLVRQDRQLVASFELFRANDEWGGPRVYEYPGAGKFSPTTLRYIKVLGDLRRHFGSLAGLRICEIGVGYGGQCRVINALERPASYRLVDIEPALALAKRYLGHFVLPATLEFLTMNELAKENYDLVISNVAFTELQRPVQDVYLERVILNCPRGYIQYNEITPEEFRSYKEQELLALIPGAQRLPDEPVIDPRNSVLVWGHRRTDNGGSPEAE